MIDDWKVMLEQNENLRQRIRDLEAVEQAMGEDLVRLAERCDQLEGEVSVERHNLAISEHQRRELEAENARLKADGQRTVDEYKNLLEHYQTVEAEVARCKESLRTWAPLNEAKAEIARLRAALDEKKSLAADSRALGC